MTRVSIVIPVYNRVDLTRQCLDSLATTVGSFAETIVVDNGSRDGTQELLRTHALGVRCIRNAENLGFAVACNQGASEARGEYLLFLNNDTIALPCWLEPMIDAVEADAGVAMVGSRLLYADGTIQHAGVVMSRAFRAPYHIYRGAKGDHPALNNAREIRAITGACMLVRRPVFEALGGFDTGFRNGFEDIDLCLKVGLRGHRILYEPKSTLYHLESGTAGRSANDQANLARFQARWGGPQWTDEDLHCFKDGMLCEVVMQGEILTGRLRPIQGDDEHARYGEVARVQAHLHLDGYERVDRVISPPERWPEDPSVLEWAEQICDALGLPSLAADFRARAERSAFAPRGSTGLPWPSRKELRTLRAQWFAKISPADVPAIPAWPRNVMRERPFLTPRQHRIVEHGR